MTKGGRQLSGIRWIQTATEMTKLTPNFYFSILVSQIWAVPETWVSCTFTVPLHLPVQQLETPPPPLMFLFGVEQQLILLASSTKLACLGTFVYTPFNMWSVVYTTWLKFPPGIEKLWTPSIDSFVGPICHVNFGPGDQNFQKIWSARLLFSERFS